MLLDLCERLLGRSQWIETQARIVSKTSAGQMWIKKVKGQDSPRFSMRREVKFQWQDLAGQQHESSLNVDQGSHISSLAVGTSIPLRYNPADSEAWYLRQILHRQVKRWTGIIVVLVALAVTIFAYLKL